MANLIGYKNRLWKIIHDFTCTQTDQPFTVDKGTYLFICKGGVGGYIAGGNASITPYGGVSYGIIDVTQQTTFHAVVGGNGGNGQGGISGDGGFNGGSPGGIAYSTNYMYGCGGGGASDIRLLPYDPNEYPTYDNANNFVQPVNPITTLHDTNNVEYKRLEYIQHTGGWDVYGNSGYACFLTDYTPNMNTKVVYDGVVFSKLANNTSWVGLFGSRIRYNQSGVGPGTVTGGFEFFAKAYTEGQIMYSRYNERETSASFVYDQRVTIVSHDTSVKWYVGDKEKGSITLEQSIRTDDCSIMAIWAIYDASFSGVVDAVPCTQLYSFKIYEVDSITGVETLVREYVPCERSSDNKVGLFETVSSTFNEGVNVDDTHVLRGEYVRSHPSIDSRIMVAGGGGGDTIISTDTHFHGLNCGGGVNGGFVHGVGSQYEPNDRRQANQTCGYSLAYATKSTKRNTQRTWSAEGAGGGGGGWYSGYISKTLTTDSDRLAMVGGGGSGYVLTEDSYKPDGYNPDAKYYFRDVFMCQAQSTTGQIIIAELVNGYNTGDVIEFPCVGESTSLTMLPGEYKMQCYGGDGGYRYKPVNSSRGGYSEGIMELKKTSTAFVHVGGSSHPRWNYAGQSAKDTHEQAIINVPTLSYNGGGVPYTNSDDLVILTGGGATDIRFEVDDMYHRAIVAGGSGSEGSSDTNATLGGVGGGDSGGYASGGNGSNNGPGTQTSAPSSSSATVAGSFGSGGCSYHVDSSYGGAGGGGWYGGSGTSDTTSTSMGGAGGSGYVLTEDSYKPDGYGLDENFYMRDAFTSSGGNNLARFQTKAIIEVINIQTGVLCRDSQGYKHYDSENNTWVLITPQPTTLTKAVFDQYQNSYMGSDVGLEDQYTLYVYDGNHSITEANMFVTPIRQTISCKMDMNKMISNIDVDTDQYDTSEFEVSVLPSERIDDKTLINIGIDKLSNDPNTTFRLYSADIQARGNTGAHKYINPDGKRDYYTLDRDTGEVVHDRRKFEYRDPEDYRDASGQIMTAQWLLPVGNGGRLPVKYRNDIIDAGVTQIYGTCSYEYNRTIYIGMCVRFLNDSSNVYLIIKGLNFMNGSVTELARIPWSNINNSYNLNGMIVDDGYYWLIHTMNQDIRYLTRIDRRTLEIVRTPSNLPYVISCYAKMKYYDEDHIVIVSRNGLGLYGKTENTWSMICSWSTDNSFRDFCVGNRLVVMTRSSSNKITVYDKETGLVSDITLSTSGNTHICYNGNGTFYITQPTYTYTFDEETQTITKSYVMSIVTNPIYANYVNGAVFILQGNDNRIIVYRPEVNNYITIYMPWSVPELGVSSGTTFYGTYIPCSSHGYFFLLYNTLCIVNYTGAAKYNMGYKYNRYVAYYNASNIDNLTYNDAFVTVHDAYVELHDGYLSYTLGSYNTNHVASIDINKADYKAFHNISFSTT